MVKGTTEQRRILSQQYSDELREYLEQNSYGPSCLVEAYKDGINSVLRGNKINVNILPLEQKGANGSIVKDLKITQRTLNSEKIVIENADSAIAGYNIYLPLTNDNKIITDKYVALHEARHLFDYICNPKTISMRSYNFMFEEEKSNSFFRIYDDFTKTYKPLQSDSHFAENIRTELSNFTDEEAINVLQASRNVITSEMNAYKDQINYLKKNPFRNAPSLFGCYDFVYNMRYSKKYQLANELLAEKLKTAREELRSKTTLQKD
ncbi:MAG: hypothetical protein K6E29_07085 [Cyanobacteria bacterium RUI128]|nr:hypothetical protein [Cyanobacteria bacterium RUI128]